MPPLTNLRRPDRRVGERLQRRKVEVRLGQRFHGGRAAEASHALTPLDPAYLVAELSRDSDIVVLALRDVQDVGLLVTQGGLAALVVGKELRIGFCNAGLVGADRIVKGVAKRMRVT